MLTWRFMEDHQRISQACLARHDGCFTAGNADAHGGLASWHRYGYDKLLLFDHVPNESDLTTDIRFFKSRLKRIDERPSRKHLQVSGKRQSEYNPCGGSF